MGVVEMHKKSGSNVSFEKIVDIMNNHVKIKNFKYWSSSGAKQIAFKYKSGDISQSNTRTMTYFYNNNTFDYSIIYGVNKNVLILNWQNNRKPSFNGNGQIMYMNTTGSKGSDPISVLIYYKYSYTNGSSSSGYVWSYYDEDGNQVKGGEDKDTLNSLAFETTAPDGYISFCPMIIASSTFGTPGRKFSAQMCSGISTWPSKGIKINGHKYYGVGNYCVQVS